MITSKITLSPEGGGRLEYEYDGDVSPTEKSELLYMLHRAMVNFQYNNRDIKLDLVVIANRTEHNILTLADWDNIQGKCPDCLTIVEEWNKTQPLKSRSPVQSLCEKHTLIGEKIDPATLPGEGNA